MAVLQIIGWCLGLVIYLVGGFVCGRICAEIVHDKNDDMNEVMWFFAGFFFNILAVFATLVVRKKN